MRPATGEDFALVLPRISAAAMSTFLAEFAQALPEDTHAVMCSTKPDGMTHGR